MTINVNKAVDKEFAGKSLKEICEAPVAGLRGLSEESGKTLAKLGIKTIGDLGTWKFAVWAQAIVRLAELEE